MQRNSSGLALQLNRMSKRIIECFNYVSIACLLASVIPQRSPGVPELPSKSMASGLYCSLCATLLSAHEYQVCFKEQQSTLKNKSLK